VRHRILDFLSLYAPLTSLTLSGTGAFVQTCTVTLTPTVVDGVDMVRQEKTCVLTPDNGNGDVSGAREYSWRFECVPNVITLCSWISAASW